VGVQRTSGDKYAKWDLQKAQINRHHMDFVKLTKPFTNLAMFLDDITHHAYIL